MGQTARVTDLLSTPDAASEHRPDWSWLEDPADAPDEQDLARARAEAERILANHGVTYGADHPDGEHPWALDPLPVIVDEADWARLDAALTQRAELLDAVLQDVYGARRLLTDRLLPPTVVVGHPGFLRQVDGLRLPGGRELVLTATDLVRDGAGGWCAIADRTQAPSGAAYAMEDRRVTAQVLAGVYRQASIQRLGPFFHTMRLALRDAAPGGVEQPRIVLLTSGPASETAFDQAYLASMLGLPLVEGSDLLVRDGALWMRGLDGAERVDVVLRRVDAEWCDPLDLRTGSELGVPGLVRAVRGGAVSVVNPLGSSVLESPALPAYLPRLARQVLDADLALPSAETWWCGEPASLSHVLAHLDDLVLIPTDRSAPGAVLGWTLAAAERDQLAARVAAEPWRWVGQAAVGPDVDRLRGAAGVGSDRPGASGVGPADLGPRAAVLRTYAVAHAGGYTVMAGGLARVAEGPLVSSASGATAKDVWVVQTQPEVAPETMPTEAAEAGDLADELVHGGRVRVAGISPRTAENLFWMGRYAERAEDTVRALRVVADRWDDFHRRPRSTGGRALTVLLDGLTPAAVEDPRGSRQQPALRTLLLDRSAPGAVARSLRRLGSAAAAVRDQLSTDTFGPLARVDRALRDERARARGRTSGGELDLGAVTDGSQVTAGLRPALDRVLDGLHAVAGISAEGLVRDVGWRFLDAGRRLERAQHVVDTVLRTFAQARTPAVEAVLVESLLLTHESVITFRRRYQSGAGVPELLDLLLLDPGNPRSLQFCLDRLREDLAGVPAPGRPTDQRDHLLADVADLAAELDVDAVVGAVDDDGRRARLAEQLESMLWRLRAAGDEIERLHFARPGPGQAFEDPWDAADEVTR